MNEIGIDGHGFKKSLFAGLFLLISIIFCTYLRIMLLFTYPLFVVAFYYIFRWKISRNSLHILGWAAICWLLSFRNGFYLTYNLISLYFFIPFILLLLAIPRKPVSPANYLKWMINALAAVLTINNVFGIIQYIIKPGDDRFVGVYGIFTVSQNGLSLLNGIAFFYYFSVYQYSGKRRNLALSLFFIACCVMGFYGAGLISLIGALILTYFKFRIRSVIQLLLITGLTLGAVTILMKTVSPATFDYNVAIIKKFTEPTARDVPRKLTAFKNYFTAYSSHPVDLALGSGPGTFNSRSAFMVGSPYYFNVDFIKSEAKPYYFLNYAYPLWNNTNTGPYDGFMNQPSTSLLALAGEYGIVFTLLLFFVVLSRFRNYNKTAIQKTGSIIVSPELRMFRFCSILLLLLIIIDNYIEYPEIVGLLLLIIKLSEAKLRKSLDI